jgi:hypothetical protein
MTDLKSDQLVDLDKTTLIAIIVELQQGCSSEINLPVSPRRPVNKFTGYARDAH